MTTECDGADAGPVKTQRFQLRLDRRMRRAISVSVRGTFNEGDDALFRKLAATIDRAVVVLDSGGGNLQAGLEIGRAIKLRALRRQSRRPRFAPRPVLSWLAGSPRLLDPTSKLDFTRPIELSTARPPNPVRRTRSSVRTSISLG